MGGREKAEREEENLRKQLQCKLELLRKTCAKIGRTAENCIENLNAFSLHPDDCTPIHESGIAGEPLSEEYCVMTTEAQYGKPEADVTQEIIARNTSAVTPRSRKSLSFECLVTTPRTYASRPKSPSDFVFAPSAITTCDYEEDPEDIQFGMSPLRSRACPL